LPKKSSKDQKVVALPASVFCNEYCCLSVCLSVCQFVNGSVAHHTPDNCTPYLKGTIGIGCPHSYTYATVRTTPQIVCATPHRTAAAERDNQRDGHRWLERLYWGRSREHPLRSLTGGHSVSYSPRIVFPAFGVVFFLGAFGPFCSFCVRADSLSFPCCGDVVHWLACFSKHRC
jgi:hypothetical protein